ncbi:hypothetical protein ON010_g1878 [Phytophthora cinnamomi]|nr:hypothetical protein ON010_g1878 [Phytophthora cinnamomi]
MFRVDPDPIPFVVNARECRADRTALVNFGLNFFTLKDMTGATVPRVTDRITTVGILCVDKMQTLFRPGHAIRKAPFVASATLTQQGYHTALGVVWKHVQVNSKDFGGIDVAYRSRILEWQSCSRLWRIYRLAQFLAAARASFEVRR